MYDTEALTAMLGAAVGLLVVFAIVFIALLVFYVIGLWKLFKKAGKGGWEAIIPYYSTWVLVEIVGLQWWWFVIALVPTILNVLGMDSLSFLGNIAGIVANVCIYYNLSKKFGFITIPLLGYSKNEVWNAAAPVTPNGVFDAKNVSASTNASAAPAPEAQQTVNQTVNNDGTNNNQQ